MGRILAACAVVLGIGGCGEGGAVRGPDAAVEVDASAESDGGLDVPATAEVATAVDPVAVAAFRAAFAEALCKKLLACPQIQVAMPWFRVATLAGCRARFTAPEAEIRHALLDDLDGVLAGKQTYHPQAAAECLALAQSASCEVVWLFLGPSCTQVVNGPMPAGGLCHRDGECAPGLRCRTDPLGQQHACPGVCEAKIESGKPCKPWEPCVDGLTCLEGACAKKPTAALGEGCTGKVCGDGQYCGGHTFGPMVCRKRAAVGEPCAGPGGCVAGARCMRVGGGWPDSVYGVCEPEGQLGDPCSPGVPFGQIFDTCAPGLACVGGPPNTKGWPTWRCAESVKVGMPCWHADGCAAWDLVCAGLADGVTGTCAPLPETGKPCTASKDGRGGVLSLPLCMPPAQCDKATSTCVAPGSVGAQCNFADECQCGLTCIASVKRCHVGGATGGACEYTEDCAPSLRCADEAGISGNTCQPEACVPPTDAWCQASWSCKLSGRCSAAGFRCVATSDADCQASSSCKSFGECHASGGRCIAKADSECAKLCKEYGYCHVVGGQCSRAQTDAECAASDVCKDHGLCTVVLGVCAATSDSDCEKASKACGWPLPLPENVKCKPSYYKCRSETVDP